MPGKKKNAAGFVSMPGEAEKYKEIVYIKTAREKREGGETPGGRIFTTRNRIITNIGGGGERGCKNVHM